MAGSPLDWLLSVSPHGWCSYMQNVSGKGLVKRKKKKDRKLYGNIRKFLWMNIINNKNKIHAWKYLRCFRSFSISIFCSVTVFRKCWLVCHKNKSETFSIRTFRNSIFKDNKKHISKKQKKNKKDKILNNYYVFWRLKCKLGSSFLTFTSMDPSKLPGPEFLSEGFLWLIFDSSSSVGNWKML